MWTSNADICYPDDVTRSSPVPYREINSQDGCRGLHGACSVSLRSFEHQSKSGYVSTGKFDLNTLRVDGNIFESGKKKLRIQKYPDTC